MATSLPESTSVYRKPTHTDQYLAYDSDHPQSVKRGIVKWLCDRSKHLITKPLVISQEKKHLSSVLVSNGYPFLFVKNITKTKKQTATKEPAPEIKSTAVLPHVKGVIRGSSPLPTTARHTDSFQI